MSNRTTNTNPQTFQEPIILDDTLTVAGATVVNSTLTATGRATLGPVVSGGAVTALAGGATTVTAAQIVASSVIQLDPEASINLTLPTSAELVAAGMAVGSHKQFILQNTANGAENITVLGGTGMDMQEPDGQNVVIGQTNFAVIDIWILTSTTSVVVVNETIPAD